MPQEGDSTPQAGQEPTPTPESKEGQEPKPEPQGTEPKEPQTFDADYVKTLRAEAAKHRKEAQEAKAKAQEYEDAQKSELEKAQGKLTKAEQAKVDAEAKLLRYEIAAEKQVPSKLVPLLTAGSKEELEAQADLILENAKADPPPQFDGGARDPAPEPKTPAQEHNDLAVALFGQPRQP